MKLRQRMLLVFAATVLGGMAMLFFLSRSLLLSSFHDLESERMKQDVEYAVTALYESYRELGTITADYAYWDRMYEYMAHPESAEIAAEFQNEMIDGLNVNLVAIANLQGQIVFAKNYDTATQAEQAVPAEFLQRLFARPQFSGENVSRMPLNGMVQSPHGIYQIALRPILTSQRSGPARGTLLLGRRFLEGPIAQISDLTGTHVLCLSLSSSLPADFRQALLRLQQNHGDVLVQPLARNSIAGYVLVPDLFDEPLLILRVDTPRPIDARGKLAQRYMFAAVFCGAVLSSLVIIFFLQKYVLSRLGQLGQQVESIGDRKATSERVAITGNDELTSLSRSINSMLSELEKAHEQFLYVTDNIHQFFWIRDAKTSRFDFISKAFEKIWGRSRDSLARDPESWREVVYPEDRDVLARDQEQQAKGLPTETYYRIVCSDGSLRWLWERSFPSCGPDSDLKQTIGLTEDITDFKRNEEALLEAQLELEQRVADRTAELAERGELVKLLVESAPSTMYGIDAEGRCTFCNPAALRLLGYSSAEEVLGKKSHELIHHTRPDGRPYPQEVCPVFESFHHGKDASVDDEVFWRKDGSSFPVEYGSRQIRRKGKVVGAVVTFTDITHRKRQDMELRHSQKLEAVGRLAAGIAHEINTPIQFVSDNTRFLQASFQDELKLIHKYQELAAAASRGDATAELLAQAAELREKADWNYLEEEIPRAMEQMLEGLGRVSTIVRGMKEFSHVDRSNEKSPADLNRALESTLIVARNELKYVADVSTDISPLPPVICHLGDLNQVFLNLLVNAAHAIEDVVKQTGRKGKIEVRTRLDGDCAEISISDTGSGIPEEARDKIFDPFFTTKEVGKGTGQGLALARAIVVEKHGGTLTFDTLMGKGTTFFIRLPLNSSVIREEALAT